MLGWHISLAKGFKEGLSLLKYRTIIINAFDTDITYRTVRSTMIYLLNFSTYLRLNNLICIACRLIQSRKGLKQNFHPPKNNIKIVSYRMRQFEFKYGVDYCKNELLNYSKVAD